MGQPFTILNVLGPYREPRAPMLSYDYSIVRPNWPTPHAVRMQISIPLELDHLKTKVLGLTGGSPGQQLHVNQILSRHIADRKLEIGNDEGLFSERRDVKIEPFEGPMSHLFPALETWMNQVKDSLRTEIKEKVGV